MKAWEKEADVRLPLGQTCAIYTGKAGGELLCMRLVKRIKVAKVVRSENGRIGPLLWRACSPCLM